MHDDRAMTADQLFALSRAFRAEAGFWPERTARGLVRAANQLRETAYLIGSEVFDVETGHVWLTAGAMQLDEMVAIREGRAISYSPPLDRRVRRE